MSQLNIIDYRSIDETAYKARPTVEVPLSIYKDELYKRRYYDNLIFKMDYSTNNNVGLFSENNEPIKLYDVYSSIDNWKNEMIEELSYRATPRLRANKTIPIRFIKELECALYKYGQIQIIYEIANDEELTNQFYNRQLKYRISPSLYEVFPRKPTEPPRVPDWDLFKEREFSDTIRISISDKIVMNGLSVSLDRLTDELKPYINSSSIFEYIYSDNVTYQDYINVLSAHKMGILELKMSNSKFDYEGMILEIYRNPFSRNDEHSEELTRLDKEFPLQITERFE
ncbi:MAG: hypothetical protein AAFX55_06015 [Bacteroidota bacterium]